jgi:hypothetical protein
MGRDGQTARLSLAINTFSPVNAVDTLAYWSGHY